MKTDLKEGGGSGPPEQKRGTRTFPEPPPIPHHVLLRRIGWGSYGEVWLARNSMGVHRAVKIVSRSSFSDARPFERELSGIRKFEPVSRTHETISPMSPRYNLIAILQRRLPVKSPRGAGCLRRIALGWAQPWPRPSMNSINADWSIGTSNRQIFFLLKAFRNLPT
jgi:hypothetical protein